MVQVANPIGNAAKYTKPGGAIEIAAAARGVRRDHGLDNGFGIPPRLLEIDLSSRPQERIARAAGWPGPRSRARSELHGGTRCCRERRSTAAGLP
jgi:hypothetical protein